MSDPNPKEISAANGGEAGDGDNRKPPSWLRTDRERRDWMPFDTTYHPIDPSWLSPHCHGSWVPPTSKPPGDLLCLNCGWNREHQYDDDYTSRLSVIYTRNNTAIWALGDKWLLRDEANNISNHMAIDYTTQQYLRNHDANVPLVKMQRFGEESDKFFFTMMSRAEGCALEHVERSLTEEQGAKIWNEIETYMKEWRTRFTRKRMETVDGKEMFDVLVGICPVSRICIPMGFSEKEWFENLTPDLSKMILYSMFLETFDPHYKKDYVGEIPVSWIVEAQERLGKFRADFPMDEGDYVLTHTDLNSQNIFVSDQGEPGNYKVTAIIDWESAGFYPWWCQGFWADSVTGASRHPEYPDRCERWAEIAAKLEPLRSFWFDYSHVLVHWPGRTNSWGRPPFCECKDHVGWNGLISDDKLGLPVKHVYAQDPDPEDDPTEPTIMFARLWYKLVERTRKHLEKTGSSHPDSEYVTLEEMLASYPKMDVVTREVNEAN